MMLLGFELLRPGWGLLLLAVPLALALGMAGLHIRRRDLSRLVDPELEGHFLPGFSRSRARLRVLLFATGTALLAFAGLGPLRGATMVEVTRRTLDIVICLDTSRSMLVEDLSPNRLERAKREVSLLFDKLAGDRVALIAFSGDVRDVAPLTRDRETLRWFLDGVSPRDNVQGGTDLGAALDSALELFDGRSGAHEAIVLLTDGEDLAGEGLAVAERAREQGIRIYVVGMGTPDGGKIPTERGYVRDEAGAEVVSSLDGSTLRSIAENSGGDYLAATDAALPLEQLYDRRISRLEGQDLVDGKLMVPHDRYQWPLLLGLICMLAEVGLRERRRKGGVS